MEKSILAQHHAEAYQSQMIGIYWQCLSSGCFVSSALSEVCGESYAYGFVISVISGLPWERGDRAQKGHGTSFF